MIMNKPILPLSIACSPVQPADPPRHYCFPWLWVPGKLHSRTPSLFITLLDKQLIRTPCSIFLQEELQLEGGLCLLQAVGGWPTAVLVQHRTLSPKRLLYEAVVLWILNNTVNRNLPEPEKQQQRLGITLYHYIDLHQHLCPATFCAGILCLSSQTTFSLQNGACKWVIRISWNLDKGFTA